MCRRFALAEEVNRTIRSLAEMSANDPKRNPGSQYKGKMLPCGAKGAGGPQ